MSIPELSKPSWTVEDRAEADEEQLDDCFEVECNPIPNEANEGSETAVVSQKCPYNNGQSMESKRYSVSDAFNLEDKPRTKLPRINCPEKIIICLDLSMEMDEVPFRLGTGTEFSPLLMIKRVLEIFLISKSLLNKKHAFALLILKETGQWMFPFTNNPKEFLRNFENVDEITRCRKADLSSCFDEIERKVTLPTIVDNEDGLPAYIVRTIFIYGRSQCVPAFLTGNEAYKRLISSNYFFIDVLYIHVTPSEENKCEAVYEQLCQMDEFGFSYIFEVSRNPTKLHDCMAKLLAHPLQRALQKDLGECNQESI